MKLVEEGILDNGHAVLFEFPMGYKSAWYVNGKIVSPGKYMEYLEEVFGIYDKREE